MIKIFHGDDRAEDQVVPWESKVLRGALDRGINLRAAKLSLKTSSKFYVVVKVRIYPLINAVPRSPGELARGVL